ncbi:MAG: hypothetical protein OSB36_07000 [Longimicrobiales bacterium]|nr:hypothetical protein [Longimicrobiales bacterium]
MLSLDFSEVFKNHGQLSPAKHGFAMCGLPRGIGVPFCAMLMLLGSGCGDGPAAFSNPGSIEVLIQSHGEMLDPNGYQVLIDGSLTRSVEINSTTEFGGLPPGLYSIEITGVASNCIVVEENPVTVLVLSDKKTIGSFGVQCFATFGS